MQLETLFAALADRTRLRLLNLMRNGEVCVCYFVEVLDLPQPTISRHLAYLRNSELVEARREGKWMHYRIAELDASQKRVLDATLLALAAERDMQKDRAALDRACCSTRVPDILKRAPKPTG